MNRVAVGQISSESNHFAAGSCELDLFRKTGFLYERDELFRLRGTDGEIAGILATLKEARDVEVVPLLAARAVSSVPLSETCYGYLKRNLVAALNDAGRVDGVILSFHGSMAAVNQDDPEGDIALAVRELVGPRVPIVLTHDLHSNVTRRRVEATTAIVAYEHYPHDDVRQTGVRGATLLLRTLRGEVRPVMAHAKLPMIATGFNASTLGDGPYAQLMRQAKALEGAGGGRGVAADVSRTGRTRSPSGRILSTSLLLVGSYLDLPDLGCSSLVITDGDPDLARREAERLARAFWAKRDEFRVETVSVAEAVRRGREIAGGPLLLLDTADTTGGGAAGDGIGLVSGLLAERVTEPCLAMVVDPDAVQACSRARIGREVTIDLGHRLDPRWGKPLRLNGKVLRRSDGRFTYRGGILGGTTATMGASVVFAVGSIQILIMSNPTYDWADEQYRAGGLDPAQAKFVGVKNMMNFRSGYGDVMKSYFVLDLPGPTPPDLRMLPFRRVRRPIFPLDENLNDPQIQISVSKWEANPCPASDAARA